MVCLSCIVRKLVQYSAIMYIFLKLVYPMQHIRIQNDMTIRDIFDQRIKEPIVNVFTQGLTPETLTISFSFGIVGGLFPIPGVTTIVCQIFVMLFTLNLPACQIVNVLLTPVQLMMMVPFIQLGNYAFGVDEDIGKVVSLFQESITGALSVAGMSIVRAVLVWALLAPFAIGGLRLLLLPVVRLLVSKKKTRE
eukprot:TRINITY_DN7558_c0_g1_i1.p1 TRINITY_DN7558_c0_g1~~TRINITY_DN7558_c0_g1_i1.p1  ORF type:complete len:193 (-),score=10.75 TRINITY_DN7558_c0_g1_i1:95-673(-)